MNRIARLLLALCACSSVIFSEFDKAEFEFSQGFLNPRLYGRMDKIEKVFNDPAMKPADFSRGLTYLCREMEKFYMTNFQEDQQKYCITIADKLRAKGAQINAVNKMHTALLSSIQSHAVVYFDYLMKNGADPNLANVDGETPLMKAAFVEKDHFFDFKTKGFYFASSLIKAGAKVNAKSRRGRTALHTAAYWGHWRMAEFLIKNGASLNMKDNDGLTPMQVAQIENRNDVVSSLKSAGAKETPLPAKYLAARQKNAENQKKAEAEAEVAQAKENARKKSEANKAYEEQLKGLKYRLDAKAAQIEAVESEMSAIGWSGPSFSSKAVTGYQCDVNNQNCRATYQGGGETGSSYWRRSDNEQKKRSLEMKHRILVNEYDSLVYKYNEILKKMQ